MDTLREILLRLAEGYAKRDLDNIDDYAALFRDDAIVMGTCTGELLFGKSGARELIQSDWEHWGDLVIDCGGARILEQRDTAWISASATVKFVFEHSAERYERYVSYINDVARDETMTPGARLAFINWMLALNFHQRDGGAREYRCPVAISIAAAREGDMWRVALIHFSMKQPDFPDERFEASAEFAANYYEQLALLENRGDAALPEELVFAPDAEIITPDNEIVNEISGINFERAAAHQFGDSIIAVAVGVSKTYINEATQLKNALDALDAILGADSPAPEKLFNAHKRCAYAIKEIAVGESFSHPVRATLMITRGEVRRMHVSYPFYWIAEGKQ